MTIKNIPRQLDEYTKNIFDIEVLRRDTVLPLPDEPFVACWAQWAEDAATRGAVAVLREHLPQLRFPVRAGISSTPEYRAATRAGAPVVGMDEATGLKLDRPEVVELRIHAAPAGRVPVLIARGRQELVALIQALASRNEPREVPPAQGATMISGLINWARVRGLEKQWSAMPPPQRVSATWPEELARISKQPELFRDRLMVLGNGPYSGVEASELGLEEAGWREMSLMIRLHHESTHYLTRRLLGSMRNHVLDELMADYAGMMAACGRFHGDWFLRFLGVERDGSRRPGGRIALYRGDPPLENAAFAELLGIVVDAVDQVERFDRDLWPDAGPRDAEDQASAVLALACVPLNELASSQGHELLARSLDEVRRHVTWRPEV